MTEHTGEVVRWVPERGFGFVKSDDFPNDIFVHSSAFGGGDLIMGRTVTFRVDNDRGGKLQCIDVRGDAVDNDAPRQRRGDRGDRGGYGRDRRDDRDRYDDRRPRYDSRDRGYDRRDARDRYDDRAPRYDSRDRGYDRREDRAPRDDRDRRDSRDRRHDSRDRN